MLADLHRLEWRTDLVFQMPRERTQLLGAEIPLALPQLQDMISHRLGSLPWQKMLILF